MDVSPNPVRMSFWWHDNFHINPELVFLRIFVLASYPDDITIKKICSILLAQSRRPTLTKSVQCEKHARQP